jgi:alpha-1,2-mannosyltransferase
MVRYWASEVVRQRGDKVKGRGLPFRKHAAIDQEAYSPPRLTTPPPLHLTTSQPPMSRWQKLVIAVGFLGVIIHFTLTVHRVGNKIGDFDVHREFGRRFLAGEYLYNQGQCFNYMPISAMYYSPMALAPPRVSMAIRYLVALVCLGLTIRFLRKTVIAGQPAGGAKAFVIALISLVLAIHYVLRDLDDGGPHLIYLAMLVGGIYCAWRGREGLGAMWLGLAAALKMTPGLFLPFLLWKRQWRLAVYTSLATLGWIVLPAIWMGPASWWRHQQDWNRVALNVFRDQPDQVLDDNDLRVQNQSLKPALMRYLTAHPAGHPLRLDHSGYRDFLTLNPATANMVANAALMGLWCAFCWKTRKATPDRWFAECAALLLLMLLFSPITWLQHVVWAIPAIYLIVAAGSKRLTPWIAVTMGIYVVLSLILNREFLGRTNYLLLLSYHTHTACLLLLLLSLQLSRAKEATAEATTIPFRRSEDFSKRRAA